MFVEMYLTVFYLEKYSRPKNSAGKNLFIICKKSVGYMGIGTTIGTNTSIVYLYVKIDNVIHLLIFSHCTWISCTQMSFRNIQHIPYLLHAV